MRFLRRFSGRARWYSRPTSLDRACCNTPQCADARSVHTIPQGRCVALGPQDIDEELEKESERLRRWMRPEAAGDGPVIVLGAGSVHLRKGVDLFIEVAARVVSAPGAGHCRFIWLGNGYDPDGRRALFRVPCRSDSAGRPRGASSSSPERHGPLRLPTGKQISSSCPRGWIRCRMSLSMHSRMGNPCSASTSPRGSPTS